MLVGSGDVVGGGWLLSVNAVTNSVISVGRKVVWYMWMFSIKLRVFLLLLFLELVGYGRLGFVYFVC